MLSIQLFLFRVPIICGYAQDNQNSIKLPQIFDWIRGSFFEDWKPFPTVLR